MRFLAILLFVAAQPLAAQVRPVPGNADSRLQSILFQPDQIVELSVASGFQLMIRFAPGEIVETIAVGDSGAWQVTASKRGDLVFIKNLQANNVTNMTIATDARVYNFELAPASGYGGPPAYSVSFVYPEPVKTIVARTNQAEFEYRIRGARAIRPKSVSFDGALTVIEWPADQLLPAIFAINGGQESLVNGEMRDGRYVLAGAPETLIFRLDKQVARATRSRKRNR
jgi:type IV secretion system protein VirB9